MSNNFVSVIIPTYNREKHIVACINSVFEQTYRPIEVLVVDDGSSDKTLKILNEYQLKYNQKDKFEIKIIEQENSGAPTARNHGFKESKGQYVQFLDSDDLLLPNKLEEQVKHLKSNNYDLTYCRALHVDEKGGDLGKYWGQELPVNSNRYFNFSWQTMCPLYQRATIDTLGLWNTSLKMNQDWEYCIRAIIQDFNIHYSSDVLCLFKKHSDGNIGTGLNINKVRSKEESAKVIYELLRSKDLIDTNLKKKFYKRFLFCLIHYSLLKSMSDFDRLLKEMDKWGLDTFLVKVFKIQFVSKSFFWLYNRR